jgi:hypothetical protein
MTRDQVHCFPILFKNVIKPSICLKKEVNFRPAHSTRTSLSPCFLLLLLDKITVKNIQKILVISKKY